MYRYYDSVYEHIKQVLLSTNVTLYKVTQRDEISTAINGNSHCYPVAVLYENRTFIVPKEQYNIDATSEIRLDMAFSVKFISNKIDDIIRIEKAIPDIFHKGHVMRYQCTNEKDDSAALSFAEHLPVKRKQENTPGIVSTSIPLLCSGIAIQKAIIDPIRFELDSDIQFRLMRHLSALNRVYLNTKEQISLLKNEQSSQRKELETQLSGFEQQIKDMYIFESVLPHKIFVDDEGFIRCFKMMCDKKLSASDAVIQYTEEREWASPILEYYSHSGDLELNRYSNAIVSHIRKKACSTIPAKVYGGDTCLNWLGELIVGQLKFPNIVVSENCDFVFGIHTYTNLNEAKELIANPYSSTALPIQYGATIQVFSQNAQELETIKQVIFDCYSSLTKIIIPDPMHANQMNIIHLLIDSYADSCENYEQYGTVYQSSITLQSFYSVYYRNVSYSRDDIYNNQRLQYRLCQAALYAYECTKKLDSAIYQFKDKYLPLVNPTMEKFDLFNAFSPNYRALKESFRNRQPIDRQLFETVLNNLTTVYPDLYDKTMQGHPYTQIESILKQNQDEFNALHTSLCDMLNISSFAEDATSLNFFLSRMAEDFDCTIDSLMDEAFQRKYERQQEAADLSREISHGIRGLVGRSVSAIKRTEGSIRQDYFGSSACLRFNYRTISCEGCTMAQYCTRYR